MIKIEDIQTYGWEACIRGMRNPMNSWDRIDSEFDCEHNCGYCQYNHTDCDPEGGVYIGKNDLGLMQRLFKGGTEHRKYLRFINVTMDITAPLYWWKEFDTYKVGTNCNSCSTMHKIHEKEFTRDDFSHEHLLPVVIDGGLHSGTWQLLDKIIGVLNSMRMQFITTKNKYYWWQMIQLLPSSYNQRRTIQMNYEVAVNIIRQRKNHKLDEWRVMVDELMNLPYMKEIMGIDKNATEDDERW